jgi:hypothetical protein
MAFKDRLNTFTFSHFKTLGSVYFSQYAPTSMMFIYKDKENTLEINACVFKMKIDNRRPLKIWLNGKLLTK